MARVLPESELCGFFQLGRIRRSRRRVRPAEAPDEIAIPPQVDWDVLRILRSDYGRSSSRAEIETLWTLSDVLETHIMIDIDEDLANKAAHRAKAKPKR